MDILVERSLVPDRVRSAFETGVYIDPWRVSETISWPDHTHDFDELVVSMAGTFTIEIDGRAWLIPPTMGVWVPAGVTHRALASPAAEFQCAYVDPSRSPVRWDQTRLVRVTPMLIATMGYLAQDDLGIQMRARAVEVFYDLLAPVEDAGIELPMPTDDRARRVSEALLENPANARHLEDWGYTVGASARTLQRLFATQTGLGFEQWRMQARMRAALVHLRQDRSVSEVSRMLGYRTVSAFVQRFAGVTGVTPGEYARRENGAMPTLNVG